MHGTFLPPPGIQARHAVLHHFSIAHSRAEAPAIVSRFQQKPFKSRRLPLRMLKQTVPRPVSEQVANDIAGLKRCKDHAANSGYTSDSFLWRTGTLFQSKALLFGSLKSTDVEISDLKT